MFFRAFILRSASGGTGHTQQTFNKTQVTTHTGPQYVGHLSSHFTKSSGWDNCNQSMKHFHFDWGETLKQQSLALSCSTCIYTPEKNTLPKSVTRKKQQFKKNCAFKYTTGLFFQNQLYLAKTIKGCENSLADLREAGPYPFQWQWTGQAARRACVSYSKTIWKLHVRTSRKTHTVPARTGKCKRCLSQESGPPGPPSGGGGSRTMMLTATRVHVKLIVPTGLWPREYRPREVVWPYSCDHQLRVIWIPFLYFCHQMANTHSFKCHGDEVLFILSGIIFLGGKFDLQQYVLFRGIGSHF